MKSFTAKDMKIAGDTPMFSGLPESVLESLFADARVIECPRGKLLFVRGEPADRFFLLLEGWLKIFRDTAEGDQTVIAILKPGETVAEAAILLGRDFPASAEVVDDARLLEIPAESFLTQLRRDNELCLKMLGSLSSRVRGLVLHIEQLQARSTAQRLGEFLLGLSGAKDGREVVQLPYDKTLVAARLGMKPESLSRALAKLRTWGVTTRGHQVELNDIAGLQRYCQGDDAD